MLLSRFLKGAKCRATKASCSSAVIRASACVVVPSPLAVAGVNWLRPTAPLPAALRTFGLKVLPVSKLITAIRKFGLTPRPSAICITLSLNSWLTRSMPGTLTRTTRAPVETVRSSVPVKVAAASPPPTALFLLRCGTPPVETGGS
ncbi:MAG TPA: hypothetical protein VG148_03750 [Pyrinomonadaceae bacterium]|nr:hypothetical protein [Pyrinomonadaceae bacterium]